jgi:hypothetical protein
LNAPVIGALGKNGIIAPIVYKGTLCGPIELKRPKIKAVLRRLTARTRGTPAGGVPLRYVNYLEKIS